mgnify:CR=1 FL=1
MKYAILLALVASTEGYNLPADEVVLQVNGVPVHVNPESMIVSNTEAATPLGLTDMVIGPDEVSVVQKSSSKDLDDKEMKASIKKFKKKISQINKSIYSHTLLGLMSAPEKTLLGLERQTLPDSPWADPGGNKVNHEGDAVEGMVGDETLGETMRIGKHTISF